MSSLGDWSGHDNKKYTGKIDRIYVSETEGYEVEYFIDHYLTKKNIPVTNARRDVVQMALEKYPGRAPHKRADLEKFLDQILK